MRAPLSTAFVLTLTLAGGLAAADAQEPPAPAAGASATQETAADAVLQRYQSAKDPAEAQGALAELAAMASQSPRAAYLCGVLWAQVDTTAAGRATARRCLDLSAKSGMAEAQHALAVLLIEADPNDPLQRAAAEQWLRASAKTLPESVYLLALLKADQAPDVSRARAEVVEKAARAGYAPAQYELARQLYALGTVESKAASRAWLDKAAAQHHGDAAVELALLIQADGRKQDAARIVALLEISSRAGSPRGDHALGVRLMTGDEIAKDSVRAFELFRRAASRGYVPAMYATGFALSEAIGTGVDEAAAVAWFRRAGDRGNANAMFAMANSYANGWGVGKSEDLAETWYCKAAQAGNVSAIEMMKRRGRCAIPPAQSTGSVSR